ncbi:MAG TPA: hypothetical protein PKW71_07760 [Anaerohalosphaeraceae bacterium]|nr:hypothetical protein [Anaerohalosphaeraceae bacterium]
MKIKNGIFIAVVLLAAFCGCRNSQISSSKTAGPFPETMVGIWQAQVGYDDQNIYGIKFEPDGSISKIVHNVGGAINVSEGGCSGLGPDPDTYYMFVLGPAVAKYNPRKKEIAVEIHIDNYEMKLPQGILKGRIIDKFSGPASQDGKTWTAEWRCYSWLEGADEPDIKEIDKNPEQLIFKKIVLNQPDSLKP